MLIDDIDCGVLVHVLYACSGQTIQCDSYPGTLNGPGDHSWFLACREMLLFMTRGCLVRIWTPSKMMYGNN